MEFKDILPMNFFNLFQSKHRDLYLESLIRVYERYEVGSILGMPKEDARDIIESMLEEMNIGLNEFIDEEDEEEIPSYRELANYIIRRLEVTGWVTIDVTNDYLEILNFTDNAVSITLALQEIKKNASFSLFADNFTLNSNEEAFRGYIFTIYSLLNSKTYDYGLLLSQVYKNTINFVREIRKVDHKLKEFIQLIDTKDNLKELVELLMDYKSEVMDKAYFKLKTFDNINKYKLQIIKKLESLQEDPDAMTIIANDYLFLAENDISRAQFIANKQINDCIDIYNSLGQIMDEIDKKNRDYITQTLSKVKYLLNDSTDVLGELYSITNYYSDLVKQGRTDKAFNDIRDLFELNVNKSLTISSISQPRGTYKKTENNVLIKTTVDFRGIVNNLFEQYKSQYKEEDIKNLLDQTIEKGTEKSMVDYISYDCDKKGILKLLYIIVFVSSSSEYELLDEESFTETKYFIIRNFTLKRRVN